MNKVILQGRLTKMPELKYTPSGTAVCTFTMAVNRRFKSQDGERQADFINCVVWQKPAETAANYLKKGFRVGVVGRWETRNYEGQDGKRVYVNECIVEEMDFIDFEKEQGQQNDTRQQTRQDNDPFTGNGQIDISDDDLPF